jgi:hypothetical protein
MALLQTYLHNGRRLILTAVLDFYPPVTMLKNDIESLAKGVHDLCSAAVERIVNSRGGCGQEVSWFVSQKAKYQKKIAAASGMVDIFYDSSNSRVADLLVAFSEDSN